MPIKLIGTSHIAKESIKAIQNEVTLNKLDIIALELDVQRKNALLSPGPRKISFSIIKKVGVIGFLFAFIGQIIQKKLGGIVGVSPGADMKEGLIQAKKHNLKIALIDRPIKITLKKFSKSITFKEKIRFVTDIIKGILFPRKQIEQIGIFDISSVPKQEVIDHMVAFVKIRYPSVYSTLIAQRDRYMVKKLQILQEAFPEANILAIVGAGHINGMVKLLNELDINFTTR